MIFKAILQADAIVIYDPHTAVRFQASSLLKNL